MLRLGQAVEVVAKGSVFYGERGTLVELLDAERCVVVALTHVARIADADMAPVPLQVRLPLDHLRLLEPATVAAATPRSEEEEDGQHGSAQPSTPASEPDAGDEGTGHE